jgi:hypothetical protein
MGLVCPEVRIAAGSLEDHVLGLVLAGLGDMPMMIREVSDTDTSAAGLRDVEAAIAATTGDMAEDDADVAALAATLASLKARRAELRAMPAERIVRYLETGETWREAFEHAATIDAQRLMIGDAVLSVSVAPATRKGGRFDPARVSVDLLPAVRAMAEATSTRSWIGDPLYTSDGTGTRQRSNGRPR